MRRHLLQAKGSAACALLLALAGGLSGQTCRPGELRVVVKDSQEAPIFGAQVHVGTEARELALRATPAMGVADFQEVPCGIWTVRVTKEGFDEGNTLAEIANQPTVEVTVVLQPQVKHSSLNVTEDAPRIEQSSSANYELHPSEVKTLPTNPATVTETLPLVPGVVRSPDGELKIDGAGEERSSLVVNQSDVTDPATGRFGQTVPIDSIETVNVLNTPFLAQYGRFTQSVVAVETKRGGEQWHYDLNDPFPDFRIRSYHMRGIRNETPRASVGGPMVHQRLYLMTALLYYLDKAQDRTLPFPFNVSKQERVNSFTQVDYLLTPSQIVNATFHFSPQHTNFVNPDFFNPQPVTPSYAQQNYVGTVGHHFGLWSGTLDSTVSFQRYNVQIGAQGSGGTTLTPQGSRGNFFGTQNRDAGRTEWLEIWSPKPFTLLGTHLLKIGTSLTTSNEVGAYTFRPVDILDAAGRRLQRIDYTNQGTFTRNDLEFTSYAQDHWALNSRVSLDYGIRVEHQRLASSLRLAPRAGIAWTPLPDGRTVFRMGYGEFYDHIPLNVYSFSRYPLRNITNFAPDGSIIGVPQNIVNVIGSATGPRTFLVHGERVAGSFSPRGATWNVQVEHRFSKALRVRGVYTDNRSVGLIVFEPDILDRTNEIVLNGDGKSRFRQAEITAKLALPSGQELNMSYTHSRAEGSLNGFDAFVGNFPGPIVRPDVYSNLAGDLPNRFLLWGHVDPHLKQFQIYPIIEYRNGFPYSRFDTLRNYVGTPNSDETRFPRFFSADARLMRDFKVSPKYTVRLSVTGFNLTNHFNALAVHANSADPQYGTFFGNYHRRYRFDFEVVF